MKRQILLAVIFPLAVCLLLLCFVACEGGNSDTSLDTVSEVSEAESKTDIDSDISAPHSDDKSGAPQEESPLPEQSTPEENSYPDEESEVSAPETSVPSVPETSEDETSREETSNPEPETNAYSKGLMYALNDDGKSYAVVHIGTCYDANVVIPETYNGLPVTRIGDAAFLNSHIRSIVIPKTVTRIGHVAFRGCTKLKKVTMPIMDQFIGVYDSRKEHRHNTGVFDKCTDIELILTIGEIDYICNNGFQYADQITSITIPDGTVSIGRNAFAECTNLKSINIPNSVTEICYEAFFKCVSLKEIDIPSSVTEIGGQAFRECTALKRIGFSEGLKNIRYNAFYGCTALTELALPSTLDTVENSIVSYCTSLTKITAGNGKFYSDSNCLINKNTSELVAGCKTSVIPDGVVIIKEEAFRGCAGLKKVVIPGSVTKIEFCAFTECTDLEELKLSDNLTYLDNYAFFGCTSLKYISIPKTLTYIGDGAFGSCYGLMSLYVDPENQTYSGEGNCLIDKKTNTLLKGTNKSEIPSGVVIIENEAFANFALLEKIVIPDTVTTIRSNAFYGCSGLKSITIPASATHIDETAFYECINVSELIIDENNPNYYASNNSLVLKEFHGTKNYLLVGFNTNVIGDDIGGIGRYAFYDNTNLKRISISESVTAIYSYAFMGCTELKEVVLPSGLTWIDTMVFSDCDSLKYIVIPKSVTTIGSDAFYNCDSLTAIYCEASEKSMDWSPNCFNDAKVYFAGQWEYVNGVPTPIN